LSVAAAAAAAAALLQATGCGEVLAKAYCRKKKLCEKHLKVR
jgi:hypothetical protein